MFEGGGVGAQVHQPPSQRSNDTPIMQYDRAMAWHHACAWIRACSSCPQLGTRLLHERHLGVLKRLPRTRNDLRAPQRLGAALVESTGWGFQAKIGLWGGFEEPIFWGSVSRFSGA